MKNPSTNQSVFGPYNNLPLDSTKWFSIMLRADDKLTLDSELGEKEASKFWVILYRNTSVPQEFFRLFVESKESIIYSCSTETEVLVTHWKEIDGVIEQCNLTFEN